MKQLKSEKPKKAVSQLPEGTENLRRPDRVGCEQPDQAEISAERDGDDE
jgi:hypothetical protein